MKKIEVFIHPLNLQFAREALADLGVNVCRVREIKTFGASPAQVRVFRGARYTDDATTELELSAIVDERVIDSAITSLESIASAGGVMVSPVEGIFRRVAPKPILANGTKPAPADSRAALNYSLPVRGHAY